MNHIEELCAILDTSGSINIKNAPLCDYCTFRIGGPAKLIAFPKNENEFITAVKAAVEYNTKYIIIGNGSNILFSDDGYDGFIISTASMKNIELNGNILKAECGSPLIQMSLTAGQAGLTGLEFAYGIPGTCGGAVFMNAGAYGSQMSAVLLSVRCFNKENNIVCEIPAEELELDYRHSAFMENDNLVIFSADVALQNGNRPQIEAQMREIMKKRRDKQPLEYPSAGSVFKRKQGYFMGQIIEESGLKGYKIGGAMVSEKHAGFIINTGGATANDVLYLVEHIKNVIMKNYGFEAECEIRYISY